MVTSVLKIFRYGNSLGMRLPKDLQVSDFGTSASENLVLADPMGEVPGEVLAKWLEEIEDKRIDWLSSKKARKNQLKIL